MNQAEFSSPTCTRVQQTLEDLWAEGLLDSELRSGSLATPDAGSADRDHHIEMTNGHIEMTNEADGATTRLTDEDRQHVAACAPCSAELADLAQFSALLRARLQRAAKTTGAGIAERTEEIITTLREEPVEATLIRRVRRPVRFVLWMALYAFSLAAFTALAVTVWRALRTL